MTKITDITIGLNICTCDALKDENCKLTNLNLKGKNITDQGVAHLCDALKDGSCKLLELRLGGNEITDQGVAHLEHTRDVLVNCKVTY